jgi:FkbM family methyltransferase
MKSVSETDKAGYRNGMIGAWLVRRFYPYGAVRTVLRGPARGVRFIVEPGLAFSFATGRASPEAAFFAKQIRPGMTVYDVGANKGQMTLLFAALVGAAGRVVSFEPAPPEFASLERNVGLNRFDQVRPVRAAASDVAGDLVFLYETAYSSRGKVLGVEPTCGPREVRQTVTVQGLPLDTVLATERPPHLVKIDVEGGGAAVLRGSRDLLEQVRPDIYIELHGPEEQAGVKHELLPRGYIARTLDGTRIDDPASGWHTPLWCTVR